MTHAEPSAAAARPVALVTGGSGGIGKATVIELARRGYDVAFTYRGNSAAARELAATTPPPTKLAAFCIDVAKWDEVEPAIAAVLERFGRLDLVVHAAGARVKWSTIHDLEVSDWTSYLAADLNGAFHVVRAALPAMRRQGGGSFVLLSSIAARMCQPRNVQGAVAKAGVEALVRVLAREEARHGIRANAVSVGLTDTAMAEDALARWGKERAAKIVEAIPLRRMGRPQEIARMIHFLASEDGAYITGQVVQVDGGQFIAG
ncbi:MAG: SDR family NAD(P)-dependent oxidoreductase [Stellaceae bacterium]